MFKHITIFCIVFLLFGCKRSATDTKEPDSEIVSFNAVARNRHADSLSEEKDSKTGLIEKDIDHLATARAAELSFHSACDQWAMANAENKDTTSAAKNIILSYFDFMEHIMKTKYRPNAAILVPAQPQQIVSAGKIAFADASLHSYVAAKGPGGIYVILWQRVAWTDHLPQHGFAAQLFIESQELRDQFAVGKVEWTDAEQRILRVSYTLGDIQGIIDIRRDDEHYPWPIHPDLGVMKRDKWLPFEKE